MTANQLHCLIALERKQDFDLAAEACGLSRAELLVEIQSLEQELRQPILKPGPQFKGFTAEGTLTMAWARRYEAEYQDLRQDLQTRKNTAKISPLLERRSVSPKRLRGPGPGAQDIELILQAALRAPDHGGLHPWRVIEFHAAQRTLLAQSFEDEKRRRDPLASARDLELAREHAMRAPVLLAFVVSPRARSKVPVREQWLSAGAALGNLLNATHQIGFGAVMLSGDRCFDAVLAAELGLGAEEFLAGFISMGSVAEAPPKKLYPSSGEVWSSWLPGGRTPEAPINDLNSTKCGL